MTCRRTVLPVVLAVTLVLWPVGGAVAASGGFGTGTSPQDRAEAGESPPKPSVTVGSVAPQTQPPGPVVGDANPTDPDGDGVYEDVNGDGSVTLADAQALLSSLDSAPAAPFDFDGDGALRVADVRVLFNITTEVADGDSDLDGLPNTYERSVTGTDAGSADTDGDGVPDGGEDADSDDLPAQVEFALGTAPGSADTDGDGLGDGFEARAGQLSPTESDTDGDGTGDAATDHDGDGLPTGEERDRGTDPFASDTDGDGAADGAEVTAGADPLVTDADGDGVADGPELTVGSDPTSADSDGDGTPDDAESYSRTVTDESTGATVSVSGSADAVGTVTVTDDTDAYSGQGALAELAVSPIVDVETDAPIDSATVTLPYDESAVADPSSLALVRFERGDFTVLDSTVDASGGTVTAETSHFSHLAIIPFEPPADPEPSVSVSPSNPTVGTEVTFEPQNLPDGLVRYRWVFGDGGTDRGRTGIHTYDEPGTYTAELIASGGGQRVTASATLSVSAPEESGGDDESSNDDTSDDGTSDGDDAGSDPVNLTDPEDTERTTIEGSGFRIGQGGETYNLTTVSGSVPVEQFYAHNENGEFSANNRFVASGTARLLGYDGPNGFSLVVILGPPGGETTMAFDGVPGSASWVVADDSPQAPTDSYSGTSRVEWSWGKGRTDGGALRGGLAGSTLTVSYSGSQSLQFVSGDGTTQNLDATQPVTVQFPEDDGDETSDSDDPVVTADFDANRTTVTTADVVRFDAGASSGPVEYYDWNFDDGNAAFGETTTYSFREPGTYEVNLTVHPTGGGVTDTATQTIEVTAPEDGEDGQNATANNTDDSGPPDSDDDGLPDSLEADGVPVQYAIGPESPPTPPVTATIGLDPENNDSDGDGVEDGYEVKAGETFTGVNGEKRYGLRSLPNATDGDDDGVPDGVENETKLDPLNPDTDGDSLDDGRERKGIPVTRWYNLTTVGESANTTDVLPGPGDDAVKTDPLASDTDGDGVDDGTEVGTDTVDQQGFTLYQLRSDPTDPTTDDGGAADGTEYEVGSDPTEVEIIVAQLRMPTYTTNPDARMPTRFGDLQRQTELGAPPGAEEDKTNAFVLVPNATGTGTVDGQTFPRSTVPLEFRMAVNGPAKETLDTDTITTRITYEDSTDTRVGILRTASVALDVGADSGLSIAEENMTLRVLASAGSDNQSPYKLIYAGELGLKLQVDGTPFGEATAGTPSTSKGYYVRSGSGLAPQLQGAISDGADAKAAIMTQVSPLPPGAPILIRAGFLQALRSQNQNAYQRLKRNPEFWTAALVEGFSGYERVINLEAEHTAEAKPHTQSIKVQL